MTRRTGAKPLTNQFAGNGKVTDEMSVTLFYWPRCSAVRSLHCATRKWRPSRFRHRCHTFRKNSVRSRNRRFILFRAGDSHFNDQRE